ncbi:MAG: sporulation protein YqfD [Clostridia bacterium]|nr:sporulation protein YqfD [Clostridia bacterium]
MINKILAFLRGSVILEAEGDFLERFLNICSNRGIFLGDIERISGQKIKAEIGIKGFCEIRPIAKKTRTRVRIKKRSGLPFLLHRYRKRRFAIVGIAVFFVILGYLSTHIMGIDIIGNQRLDASQIESGLKEFGVYRGAALSSVDRKLVQNKMMTKFDDIAWIGINIKGSRVYIEVKERLDTKRTVDKDIPCNLVASRDGQIMGLEVVSGQTMVKMNDMVEKGDLLVSGAMDSGVVGIRYAHADGAVFARTIYKKSKKYPLEFVEKNYTGNAKKRYSITLFGKEIRLFLNNKLPFEYSDQKEEKKNYYIISDKFFTIGTSKTLYSEYVPQKKRRTETEAASLGKTELAHELENEIGNKAKVESRNFSYKVIDKNTVEVTAEFVCTEDISQKSVIDKTENMDYN